MIAQIGQSKSRERKEWTMATYTITVDTADIEDAGTDSYVRITLYGTEGQTDPILLDPAPERFERGNSDVFSNEARDVGELTQVRIELGPEDMTGDKPGWLPTFIAIQNNENGNEWIVPCYRWFARDEDDKQTRRILKATPLTQLATYRVTVLTGDKNGAGTDANIYIKLIADNDVTDWYILDNDADNFERGRPDVFEFNLPNLGELRKIELRNDSSGSQPGWFLDRVIILNESDGRQWTFKLQDQNGNFGSGWLAKGEWGGTDRWLLPVQVENTQRPAALTKHRIVHGKSVGSTIEKR
jgi:hypothetical protein